MRLVGTVVRIGAIATLAMSWMALGLEPGAASSAAPKPLGTGPIKVTLEGHVELGGASGRIGASTFTGSGTMRGKARVLGSATGTADGTGTWPDGPCTINPKMTYDLSADRQGANLVLLIEPHATSIVGTGVKQCQDTVTLATSVPLPTVTIAAKDGATATATGTAGGGTTAQSVTVTLKAK